MLAFDLSLFHNWELSGYFTELLILLIVFQKSKFGKMLLDPDFYKKLLNFDKVSLGIHLKQEKWQLFDNAV